MSRFARRALTFVWHGHSELTKTNSECHAMYNAASLPCGQKKTSYRVHRAGLVPLAHLATNGLLQPNAGRRCPVRGRAMKPRSSAIPVSQAPKSPAALADPELAHLEAVIRHLSNTDILDAGFSLGVSYWLTRIAEIERRFYLVPLQIRRLALLRKILTDLG